MAACSPSSSSELETVVDSAKQASRFGASVIALGLGLAVASGQGVANADPGESGSFRESDYPPALQV